MSLFLPPPLSLPFVRPIVTPTVTLTHSARKSWAGTPVWIYNA